MFTNYNFKVNLKSHLSITVLRLIFKTVVTECGFIKKNNNNNNNFTNILKRSLYMSLNILKKSLYILFFFSKNELLLY